MQNPGAAKSGNYDERLRKDIDRTNAMLRHFRGVALSVLNDAEKTLDQIRDACADSRTCEQIIDGLEEPEASLPACGWPELREKLHLLGHYLDYTKRLLEGSVSDEPTRKGGAQ